MALPRIGHYRLHFHTVLDQGEVRRPCTAHRVPGLQEAVVLLELESYGKIFKK